MRPVWIALLLVLVATGGLVLYARLGATPGKEGLALRFLTAFWEGDEDALRELATPMYHRVNMPHVRDQQRTAYQDLFGPEPPREVEFLALSAADDPRRAQRAEIEVRFEKVVAPGRMVLVQYRGAWGVDSFELDVPEGLNAQPSWQQLQALADIGHLLWDELDHGAVTEVFPPLHPLTTAEIRAPFAATLAELGHLIVTEVPRVEREGETRGRVVFGSTLENGSAEVVVTLVWQVWQWRIERVEVKR
jgi:hypothetical protein